MSAVTYRKANLDDAPLAADLMTAAYPAMARDPVMVRYRWETPRRDFAYARFIGERNGTPIAFLGWVHGPWTEAGHRHCEVEVWLDLAQLDRGVLAAMYQWIDADAVAEGTQLLLAYCAEDEPETLGVLASLGFYRERTEKVWELDLQRNGSRLTAEAAEAKHATAAAGIRLVTLAEWNKPEALGKLHELDAITRQDIPTSLPIFHEAFDDFVLRTKAPDRRPDRLWIALDGATPVALTYLKFPPLRGAVWTGYTCSHPAYRGRGLARAVKLQSLAQAAALGVPLVCTDNDSENSPMLHINDRLGYVRRPGFVEHHKRVSKT